METNIVSVERIKEYTEIPTEVSALHSVKFDHNSNIGYIALNSSCYLQLGRLGYS